jgi:hypothetical protein
VSDNIQSSAAMMSWWLEGGDSPMPALPSWIAPRLLSHELVSLPTGEGPPQRLLSSVAPPPNTRLIASLRPPGNLQIAIQEEAPAYPDLREENAELRKQIAEMAITMARFRRDVLEASEDELVKLACVVAERVTRHELLTTPDIVVGWAREAIESLGAKEGVTIAIAPDLAAVLDAGVWSDLARGSIVVETDPSLRSFQCEVRARSSSVDASMEGRVAAIARELGASNE